MSFGDTFACENGCGKRACERVAGSNSVGNFYNWRLLIRLYIGGKHVRAVYTAGKHEHVKVVLANEQPAFVLHIQARIAEDATNGNQFFVVYLQYVALFERVSDNGFVVKVLPKVYIKYL